MQEARGISDNTEEVPLVDDRPASLPSLVDHAVTVGSDRGNRESSWCGPTARGPRHGLKHMQWWPPATLRPCRCGDRWVIGCRRGPQAGYGILKPRLLRAGNGGSQLGH